MNPSARYPSYQTLSVTADGPVLSVTFARPEARNTLTHPMMCELGDAFGRIAADAATRVVVLRGAGGWFCAGGDFAMLRDVPPPPVPGEEDALRGPYRRFGEVLKALDTLPQAVVAVVEGAAAGGGLGMVCCADVALGTAAAKFTIPEARAGFIPSQMLPWLVRRVGEGQARRMAVTGVRLDGREACRIGLIHECCDEAAGLEAALSRTLADLLACEPGSVAALKRLLVRAGERPLDEFLDAAADSLIERLRDPAAQEGIAAFLDKRPPRWAR